LYVTGSRSDVVISAVEKSDVEKSNNKELIQSTLYDQQTPYAAWKLYFPDQCRFDFRPTRHGPPVSVNTVGYYDTQPITVGQL